MYNISIYSPYVFLPRVGGIQQLIKQAGGIFTEKGLLGVSIILTPAFTSVSLVILA